MGLNELIDELERNINTLEQSYENKEKGDVAKRIKERIERNKAILQDEKTYRDEVNSNASQMLELKRMYQEITVIQRELDKDISSESSRNLLSRLNEVVRIARDRFGLKIAEGAGIEGATEGIKRIIKETEFTINRLNGNIEDSEIDEDRKKLDTVIQKLESEEFQSQLENLKDFSEKNEALEKAEADIESLKKLIRDAAYVRTQLVNMENTVGRNSEEYKELLARKNKIEQEVGDLVTGINMCDVMFGYGGTLDAEALSLDEIDDFASRMRKEKTVVLDGLKKARQVVIPVINERNAILRKYGVIEDKGFDLTGDEIKDVFNTAVQKISDDHEKYIKYRRNGYAMSKVKGEINGTHTGKGQPTSKNKPAPQNTPTPKGAPDKNSKPAPGENTTPIGGTIGQSKNKTNQNLNPSFETRNTREEHEEAKENLPAKKQGLFSRLFSKDKSIDEIQEVYERPQSMEVFLMQNDDKINARDGKMSFFDIEGDKLVRKERDLSYYTKKPSKALNKSIDGIRERMIKLYGKEGLKEICKDMKKENGGKDTEFTKIMSGSIIKSGVASFRFRGRDEIDGKSKDSQSEIIRNQIKVAMALDSAMTPEEVCDILKSPEKAYSNHDADLDYITVKGRFPFSSPKPMEYKKSTLEQLYEGKTEPKLGIEIKFDENGRLNVSFDDDRNKNRQRDVNKGQDRD
jgi:hypothetical protein